MRALGILLSLLSAPSLLSCTAPVEPLLEVSPEAPRLAPGQEVQLTVTRRFPGGGIDDATGRVHYASSNRELLGVTPTGRLVARAGTGDVLVQVTDPTTDASALVAVRVVATP
jgi:hypothetical protein